MRMVLAAGSVAFLLSGVAAADIFNGSGGSIPDNNPAGIVSTINVANAGQVGVFNGLTINGLTHTWVGDVVITLTLPDATVITIADRIGKTSATTGFGDSSNFGGNYTFNDAGGDIWASAASGDTNFVIPTGAYRASAALTGAAINLNALIAGKNVTGDWKLTITDGAAGDTGSYTDWSLNFSIVPTPGALALLGLAGLAGRRRR
ncbi:MAG: proprotein convertase P-domain-containing protein [Phycisphaerales bacterium]